MFNRGSGNSLPLSCIVLSPLMACACTVDRLNVSAGQAVLNSDTVWGALRGNNPAIHTVVYHELKVLQSIFFNSSMLAD